MKTPKLGNYLVAACGGVGETAKYYRAGDRSGTCPKCEKHVELRKGTPTVRFHGTREARYSGVYA